MTNEMIIFNNRIELQKKNIIKGTGNMIEVEINGKKITLEEPEEIHTFNGWKQRGYKVKKGEHSSIKFPIWKYVEKKKKPEELTGNELIDAPKTSMFMKMSAFFTQAQVEKA